MSTSIRVLFVEDSEDDVLLLIRELRRGGYELVCQRVDSAAGFLSALEQEVWDLIIADYSLPQFSGLAALKLVNERQLDVPFLIISGIIDEQIAVEAMKNGAHDYLMKDNLKRLAPAVERELREALVRRQQRAAEYERQQANEALRRSAEQYRDLFENANDVIYMQDLQGNFLAINKKAEQLSGYTRAEVTQLHFSQIVAPEYLEIAKANIAKKLQGESDQTIYELEMICKDGRRLPLEVNTRLLYEDGAPVGIQGIARDISERKLLEEQLRQAQKMEAIGRLAGAVAHDFNNLLTAILGYSQLLLHRLVPGAPMYKEIVEIEKAGRRAAALTNQLLTFSRKQVFDPQVLNLNPVVTDIERMLHRLIGEDVELTVDLDAALDRVKADRGQLEQVIMNLAVNSRDAMPQGGKLTIATTNVEVRSAIGEIKPGAYVTLTVADTGMGMDRETQARIFEPFFTTKEAGKGTGLGLATVYGIVKQSGGSIECVSEIGKGTLFRIYLPQIQDVILAPEPPSLPEQNYLGHETVLLVEDDDAVRELTRQMLELNGYEVLEARDAHEALSLCHEQARPIPLMVTDVVMPQINGRALAQRIANFWPSIKVLLISGYTDNHLASSSGGERSFSLLQKPFTPEALLGRVRSLLDGA